VGMNLREGLAYWQDRTDEEGACHAERRVFLAFCDRHRLQPSPDAVSLYLIHLYDQRPRSVAALRYRLRHLDLAAALAGEPLPSADPGLRRFMLGLHRALADSEDASRDPLYIEHVHAALQAIDRDRGRQLRDAAFVSLVASTGITVDTARCLSWHQVRLRSRRVEVTVPEMKWGRGTRGVVKLADADDDTGAAARAIRAWHREAASSGHVFTSRNGAPMSLVRASELLDPLLDEPRRVGKPLRLPPHDEVTSYIDTLLRPTVRQLRDAALILLGFAACLTTQEVRQLRLRDIERCPQGLLIRITGRRRAVGVPRGRDLQRCPVTAWEHWLAGRAEPAATRNEDAFAFTSVRDTFVSSAPMDDKAASRVVRQRCVQAGLAGDYGFISLRLGFLRTAARAGVPEDVIASHAGLSRLDSAALHVRRERLITHSAAGMVGL
jgi:integrase